jgi:hypothetical protein
MRHSHIRRLEERIILFRPLHDKHKDNKRYLPYCDLGWHQGIVRDYFMCEQRCCKHYKKLYINAEQ